MSEDGVLRAVLIELQHVVAEGWSASIAGDQLVVVGPDSASFRAEVWRIAQFVAYDEYVCVERSDAGDREYVVVSRSRRGSSFRLVIRAASPALDDGGGA